MSNAPDFSHAGEFIDWGENPTLEERFVKLIDIARHNIGQDVELARWSPDEPLADMFADWWTTQRRAVVAHVGVIAGMKVTASRKMHKRDGVYLCYVRFNRKRMAVAA